MPKLSKTLDNLDGTRRKTRVQGEKALHTAVQSNTDALAGRIDAALHNLNNASNQSRQQLANVMIAEFRKLAPVIVKAHDDQVRRIDKLETQLAKSEQLGRDNIKVLLGGMEKSLLDSVRALPTHEEAFSGIRESLSNLPTVFPRTDLLPMQELVTTVLERIDGIEPVVIPARKEKFTFIVHRDESDMITKVTVN